MHASSVFSALQSIAYHRDISARNILVRDNGLGDDGKAQMNFTIVDFGLAALSDSWKHGDWHSLDLVGDLRYWSPASWMVFAHGSSHLEQLRYTGFRRMYEERIDHFAIGILVLELFFALWGGPERGGTERSQQSSPLGVAYAAWNVYWATIYGLFQRFHSDTGRSRSTLRRRVQDCLPILVADHKGLVSALRAAARTARAEAQPEDNGLEAAAPLLFACSELLDARSELRWERMPETLTSDSMARGASGEPAVASPVSPDALRRVSRAPAPENRRRSPCLGGSRRTESCQELPGTARASVGAARAAGAGRRRTPSLPPHRKHVPVRPSGPPSRS